MIRVTDDIAIDESEITFEFIRSSGPGGQNVNKVASAVQLRFDLAHSTSLPDSVKERLAASAARRINRDGVLVITARRHRTQDRNRQDAIERLIALVRAAAARRRRRKRTSPTRVSQERRLEEKRRRGRLKRVRSGDTADQE